MRPRADRVADFQGMRMDQRRDHPGLRDLTTPGRHKATSPLPDPIETPRRMFRGGPGANDFAAADAERVKRPSVVVNPDGRHRYENHNHYIIYQ
jgi:hypothetical protein